ncbi:MAG: cyclase family protein [Pseudomonadota bacterium]
MTGFRDYAALDRPDATGLPLAWGIWGPDDELGTLNNITPETVRASAAQIRRGVRFSLDLPLHLPFGKTLPGAHRRRAAPTPTLFVEDGPERLGRDDKLDGFWLQGSSQWDSLTHIGDPRHGFYNGVRPEQVTHGEGSRNGIDKVARFGLAGRGVLVDVPRYCAAIGRTWSPMGQLLFSAADLAACLDHQGVVVQPGDILLVRLGWVRALLDASGPAADTLFRPRNYSGLSGGEDMWQFLWDQRIAAVAADSVTVEVWPMQDGKPSLHLAIARLGLTIGEMFDFEALAEDCAATHDYCSFVTSSPLNLRGGVGSPPNAMAIR